MRILAGQYKGRKLLPPVGWGTTRPMTGLVKKSLFGMLGEWLDGAVVLDLYCGTGTLGLEALSRGAARCCFAERGRSALQRLQRNIEALGLAERSVIWRGELTANLARWLKTLADPVDVAFVDPPFEAVRRWSWPRAEEAIFAPLAEHLAGEGVVVLRTPADLGRPGRLANLAVRRDRRYGEMIVTLFQQAEK